MLHDAEHFEPLTDEPWNEGRVRDAIAAVVADTDAGFDATALWPATDPFDEYGQPTKVLYAGAAGTIWALDELRRRTARPPQRRSRMAPRRRLPRPRNPSRRGRQHALVASCRAGRRARARDGGSPLPPRSTRRRPGQLAGRDRATACETSRRRD